MRVSRHQKHATFNAVLCDAEFAIVQAATPWGNHMAAYFIVQSTISDEPQYQKYRDAVIPLMARFGGKMIVRGAKVEALEGRHDGRRMVIFEFPSMDAIHAFWSSPDYVPVKKIREGAAALDVWAVAGVQ
jgi:uncharacterized protein (DUF1330 family)